MHVIFQPFNQGKGAACRTGFAHARGQYVVIQDADAEYDPNELPKLLEPLLDDRADVVFGSRYLHGVTVVNWPLSRLILSYSANLYTRIVTGLPLMDATGGFKCFRRRALEGIIGLFTWRGGRHEMPADVENRPCRP